MAPAGGLKDENRTGRRWLLGVKVVFLVANLAIIARMVVLNNFELFSRALLFPLFLFIPNVLGALGLKPCYRLMCSIYLFSLYAYSYGCVYGAFKESAVSDKVSHFLSGFLFTIVGMCLYVWQVPPRGGKDGGWITALFGLGLSQVVAVGWEVCEMLGFVLFGNDAQHHLTTGVFDTMFDLTACLIASVLCGGAFVLYKTRGVKLYTGWVMEEFIAQNAPPPNDALPPPDEAA